MPSKQNAALLSAIIFYPLYLGTMEDLSRARYPDEACSVTTLRVPGTLARGTRSQSSGPLFAENSTGRPGREESQGTSRETRAR